MSAVPLIPGVPVIEDGTLTSTNPVTGAVVGTFPVAGAEDLAAAVAGAREAGAWWRRLGFDGRRERLLRWAGAIARRLPELTALMHAEGGKPVADATVEAAAALEHLAWAAKNARRVLRLRRQRGSIMLAEFSAWLEYQPYGVVGVIGPWNYPIHTPMGSLAYALAAGNAVVFKPSEYTPAIADWYVQRFAEVVPEQPVLQIVFGGGETGAALVASGVDKVAFTGSTATGKKIMAACAETLTPVLLECGGKDAMIVDSDADLDAAADACCWGALTNAGQACVSIERAYVVAPVYDAFLDKLVGRVSKLRVGGDADADLGPITMPGQIDIIARHIDDALSRGGRAVVGGREAVQPPFVHPTILVDVPQDSTAITEETFGPTLTVTKVADADEAVRLANATSYGLGGAVFGRARALSLARRMRSGMTAVNGTLSFAGMGSLPFGGTGDSGIGRIHGADGLREFARPKAITKRRAPSLIPSTTFDRTPTDTSRIVKIVRLLHRHR
ncbi:aldehyde dehydrogenase family protein [Luedemannella flava]|uniref:Aldehyde dehydrogenase n=1 Tax=Luedemannella flava TaxID=349316 RepID=A0ABP4Y884_9ACTN